MTAFGWLLDSGPGTPPLRARWGRTGRRGSGRRGSGLAGVHGRDQRLLGWFDLAAVDLHRGGAVDAPVGGQLRHVRSPGEVLAVVYACGERRFSDPDGAGDPDQLVVAAPGAAFGRTGTC